MVPVRTDGRLAVSLAHRGRHRRSDPGLGHHHRPAPAGRPPLARTAFHSATKGDVILFSYGVLSIVVLWFRWGNGIDIHNGSKNINLDTSYFLHSSFFISKSQAQLMSGAWKQQCLACCFPAVGQTFLKSVVVFNTNTVCGTRTGSCSHLPPPPPSADSAC